MDNIEVFNDTLFKIKHNWELAEKTRTAIDKTRVYEEEFHSLKKPCFPDSRIFFEESLSLLSAYRFADRGMKTGVLNFANPIEPGGGVLRGASAQEEYLCRASNLYPCLTSEQAEKYYNDHNETFKNNRVNSMLLATDRLIYSPNVTFFREDRNYSPGTGCTPLQQYTDHWRHMNVITCAAPYFSDTGCILPHGDLLHLFCRRIQNVLEVAIEHNIEALVLGAFGCGAFHNPPTVVAEAFRRVFMQNRYRYAFSDVVFAVKSTGPGCENIEAFKTVFQHFPSNGKHELI